MTQQNAMQTNRISASLFTLIVYMRDRRRQEHFSNLIRMIIEKFPCRIILIEADPDATKDSLEQTLSEESVITGDIVISCDQYTIKASGKMAARVPFIVLSLLVPDLPTYLLWSEDPTIKNEIFTAIHQFTPHIIFDCDVVPNMPAFSNAILQQLRDSNNDLIDMKWVAIAGWRDVFAQTFENAENIALLQDAKAITISYNAQETAYCKHTHTQATYLQAWLASCLKWSLVKKEENAQAIQLTYVNDKKHEVLIALVKSKHDHLQPGSILQIDIECRNALTYSITRQQKLPMVTVHIASAEACLLPFNIPLPHLERGISFMKEIFYASHSKHYEKTLQLLAKQDLS